MILCLMLGWDLIAEIHELVRLYLLNQVSTVIDKSSVGS